MTTRLLTFSTEFHRKKTSTGLLYTFSINQQAQEGICCVEGETLVLNDTLESIHKKTTALPEECLNPLRFKALFTQWLEDCSGVFLKPPTLTQCLSNVSSFHDVSANIVSIPPEEEEEDWLLLWVPTKLSLSQGAFRIGWAPLFKRKCTRIPALTEFLEMEEARMEDIHEVQISNSLEQTSQALQEPTRSHEDWSQDILGLETTTQIAQNKEKFRKRIHDARIRAKLARYRAEQLANLYYRKFGEWPEENEEEAETVFESSSEEETEP